METWRPVVPYAALSGIGLEVSSLGRVRRAPLKHITRGRWGTPHTATKPAKILSQCQARHGYLEVAVQFNGTRHKLRVHRLIAMAFVPGYQPGLTVNHINGVKTDNSPVNLEWVTHSRNSAHAWETGLVNLRGDAHPSRKLSSGRVRIIRDLLKLGATPNQIAVLCGLSPSTIYLIRDGKRWSEV